MVAQWQYNPEGVPATIQQDDDGSLNTSDVNIWMWLRAITPTKGVMVRQHILQLFSKAGQWVLLINMDNLLAPSSSKLCNSIQATYEPGTQPPSEIPMKNLARWLGKYAGMSYIHAVQLEGYAKHAPAKMAHSDASQIRKHLHEMAKTKDHLGCERMWVEMLRQLNKELSVWAPTNQLSVTDFSVTPPPYNAKGGSTETWPVLAPYKASNIHMGDVDDSVTNDIYK